MELAFLTGSALVAYLMNQKKRENVFERENSIPVQVIANKYAPFNDPRYASVVGCTASYPGYVNPNLLKKGVQVPYGYNTDPNYIHYINNVYGQGNELLEKNYNDVYSGPFLPRDMSDPHMGTVLNPTYSGYSRMEADKARAFQRMVDEQGEYVEGKKKNKKIENFVNEWGIDEEDGDIGIEVNNDFLNDLPSYDFPNNGGEWDNQNNFFSGETGNFDPIMSFNEPVELDIVSSMDTNFVPNNDPTADYIQDMSQRPISDFTHNNMVPFFGAKVTQNMAGTGVQQGNYTDGINVNSGFDNTTPFQHTLANFTGTDDTYRSKREVGPMFSPAEQQTNYVYGQPLFRPDLDRYQQSISYKNDLKPTEPIMVGPGLNLDPSIPAAGGFHEFTRILPNNVSDYKANQLEGRVNAGKMFSAGLPTAYPGAGVDSNGKTTVGVPKNKPESYYTQTRRPTMASFAGGLPEQEMMRADWNVDKKPSNSAREQTSYGYGTLKKLGGNEEFSNLAPEGYCVDLSGTVGIMPAKSNVAMLTPRDPTYMSQDNNIRSVSDCNSVPMGAPAREGKMGPEITNFYVNETDRGNISPTVVEQIALKGQDKGTFITWVDEAKVTNKETTSFSYAGDVSNEKMGQLINTWDDLPKTRTIETTLFSYSGDPNRQSQGNLINTWDDLPKTRTIETTEFSYSGDPSEPKRGSLSWKFEDKPRSTIKQNTQFSYAGDPNKQNQGSLSWKFEDKPKSTIKQNTQFSYTNNPARPDQGSLSWKFEDVPKSTVKQSTNFSYAGGLGIANGSKYEMSRFSFMGPNSSIREDFGNIVEKPEKLKRFKPRLGGADTTTIRGTTLVKDYFPGPGRTNILLDPDQAIGKVNFGTFGLDEMRQNGPGTLLSSIPDASRYQNNRVFAKPHVNPNKLESIDDRQIATYQIDSLKQNPLSIFTNNLSGEIPNLYANTEPDNFSPVINESSPAVTDKNYDDLLKERAKQNEEIGIDSQGAGQVYPKDGKVFNSISDHTGILSPNANIVYNALGSNGIFNPLIERTNKIPNQNPTFSGRSYSGSFKDINGKKITIGGPNEPKVYGSLKNMVPIQENDVFATPMTEDKACKPNDALMFANE